MSADGKDGEPKPSPPDVALIHGVTPEGDLQVIRKREDRLEFGAVRALKEGVPIVGEVVTLTPRKDFPLLCDVETALTVPGPRPVSPPADLARKGPAQVATDEYRRHWDDIFGRPETKPRLSN